MDVVKMYEEFRNQYPELTKAADAIHVKTWGSVDHETVFCWFESLAEAVNDQMGVPEQHAELTSVFKYIEMKFVDGSNEVKNCIDVSFVENLFWRVSPRNTGLVWTVLPTHLQRLYIAFHGRQPK